MYARSFIRGLLPLSPGDGPRAVWGQEQCQGGPPFPPSLSDGDTDNLQATRQVRAVSSPCVKGYEDKEAGSRRGEGGLRLWWMGSGQASLRRSYLEQGLRAAQVRQQLSGLE